MFFYKKNDLNYALNSYKLKQYMYRKDRFIFNEVSAVKIDKAINYEKIKQKCLMIFLSCLGIYSFNQRTKLASANLVSEEVIQAFSPLDSDKAKSWIFNMERSSTIEVPRLEVNDFGGFSPIESLKKGMNYTGFNTFCSNFNKACEAISKLIKDIKWIIDNPLKSVLIVDLFCFQILSIFLLIFFIVSLFVKMFTGEAELKKPLQFLKNGTLITFILSIVLQCFIGAGCN